MVRLVVKLGSCFCTFCCLQGGCTPKWMLFPSSIFFLEIVMLFSSHLLRTVSILSSSSASSFAQMIVSSTIFMEKGRPRMMTSDYRHHSSDDALSVKRQLEVTVDCVQFAEQFSNRRYCLDDLSC